MSRQLTFDLPLREARGRDDFFVSPSNALALATLDGWRDWPGGKLVLTGRTGSGKSHLAHVWAGGCEAPIIAARELPGQDLPALAQTALGVEDAETLAGDRIRETALFHLHNLMAERRLPLLITATTPPRDWGLVLPDLASRMQATQIARIETPDDALLTAVLLKQFQDRQIVVAPSVITYLARHMDRSLSLARAVVAAIDARTLSERVPVSRNLATEVLQALAEAEDARS